MLLIMHWTQPRAISLINSNSPLVGGLRFPFLPGGRNQFWVGSFWAAISAAAPPLSWSLILAQSALA